MIETIIVVALIFLFWLLNARKKVTKRQKNKSRKKENKSIRDRIMRRYL